jgi:NADH-quinone oxidoreductase subunit B
MEKEGPGMEMNAGKGYSFDYSDVDIKEGREIEEFKTSHKYSIPDRDEWLDTETRRNIVVTSLDWVIDWARRSSMWTVVCYPACCGMEWMAALGPRFDASRFGMEIMRASPRQADLLITAGTLTWKMAPNVRRIYEQMAEPKWVIVMGNCGISGGIFRSGYNVVPGWNKIVPVDVYVPGCPPRPEALIYGIQMLQKKIGKAKAIPDLSDIQLPKLPKEQMPRLGIPRLEQYSGDKKEDGK